MIWQGTQQVYTISRIQRYGVRWVKLGQNSGLKGITSRGQRVARNGQRIVEEWVRRERLRPLHY